MQVKTIFFAVLTMTLWGIAPLFSKIALEKIPPFPAMLMRNLMLVALALGALIFSSRFRFHLFNSPKHTIYLIIAGTISGLIGQYTYYMALQEGQISQVVPIVSSFPLMTAFLSFVVLNEPLTMNRILGILMIIGGIFLIRM